MAYGPFLPTSHPRFPSSGFDFVAVDIDCPATHTSGRAARCHGPRGKSHRQSRREMRSFSTCPEPGERIGNDPPTVDGPCSENTWWDYFDFPFFGFSQLVLFSPPPVAQGLGTLHPGTTAGESCTIIPSGGLRIHLISHLATLRWVQEHCTVLYAGSLGKMCDAPHLGQFFERQIEWSK